MLLVLLNAGWHLLLYGTADNRVPFEVVVQHLWPTCIFEVNWILPDHTARSPAQHDTLVEAVRAGDLDAVDQLVREHILRGEAAARHVLATQGNRDGNEQPT